jgi:hypothetical protein
MEINQELSEKAKADLILVEDARKATRRHLQD